MRNLAGRLRLLATAALAAVCATSGIVRTASPDGSGETRALWVLRTSLVSPGSIDTVVREAHENGFNTLVVQVRGRGDAYYRGGVEPMPADLLRQAAAFDPLAAVLQKARAAGIRVHAWVNVNLVSSAVNIPTAREHIIHRHPEWLMVPRELAAALAATAPKSPGYVGKLARWTRGQPDQVEGLYASPVTPSAAAYLETVVRDIVRRYPVDGIHFDYARYPDSRFDYSRTAIAHFRAAMRPRLEEGRRRALDAAERVDPLAYPDAYPAEWRDFRVERMTALMTRLRDAVRSERPAAVVSVAAAPDRAEALSRKMQDWGAWLQDDVVDVVAPMAYTQEPAQFAEQVAAARHAAGSKAVWAGIGAYRLTPSQTVDNIRAARRLGASGIILFSYDSLVSPRQSAGEYLGAVSRAAFADGRSEDLSSR
jgi:uncharacterized lipoprotein YddW (UPF0748 family)